MLKKSKSFRIIRSEHINGKNSDMSIRWRGLILRQKSGLKMQIKYCVQRNVSKNESIGIQKMNFVSRYFLIRLKEWAFYVDCTI